MTVSNANPFCPTCGTSLVLTREGEFNPWVCPNGHGLAATTSEVYVRAQEDELDQLWKLAKQAAPGPRKCPMCEQPMVVVDLAWDRDEVFEGTAGDGSDDGHEPLDVCVVDEVVWFDAGELDLLPADLPDPEPTPEEQEHITHIAETFATDVVDAERAETDHTITGQLTNLILRHSKAAQGMVRRRRTHVDAVMNDADRTA